MSQAVHGSDAYWKLKKARRKGALRMGKILHRKRIHKQGAALPWLPAALQAAILAAGILLLLIAGFL